MVMANLYDVEERTPQISHGIDNQIFGHGQNHEYTTEYRHAARWANDDLGKP
jgi:hypothetical protein